MDASVWAHPFRFDQTDISQFPILYYFCALKNDEAMNTIWIVLPILTLLMFELGLTLRVEDFRLFYKRPRPVIAGLVGQLLFLPLVTREKQ